MKSGHQKPYLVRIMEASSCQCFHSEYNLYCIALMFKHHFRHLKTMYEMISTRFRACFQLIGLIIKIRCYLTADKEKQLRLIMMLAQYLESRQVNHSHFKES